MADEKPPVPLTLFLETYPLYRKITLATDECYLPPRLSLNCPRCGKETTWALKNQPANGYWQYTGAVYECALCGKNEIRFFLYHSVGEKLLVKVGQYPEPSITIPKLVEDGLKDSAAHYKKGLISLNQGYGIGAVAYFRRVVEERTSELIDVVAELAKANGAAEEEVQRILAAKSERTFDRRLEVASEMIPKNLRPGDVNPLGRLHALLSEALHVHAEDDALRTGDEIREIIEHVFRNLREYINAQRRYAEKVRRTGAAETT